MVGNSTELKNGILFDNVQVPHYNYVGDSILGYKSHMGAGAVTSNVKQDKTPVTVQVGYLRVETGLKKFGAMLGDNVEVGCNSVLNPGTVVGRGSRVYPLSMVRGFLPAGQIHKNNGERVPLREALTAAGEIRTAAIITGPEGGFEPFEADLAAAVGIQACAMGPRILRCETAPLCALTAVLYAAGALD